MKTCAECHEEQPVSEFYRTKAGSPMHICKTCHKQRMHRNRRTNPDVQARERLRAKRPDRKQAARQVTIKWRAAHPDAYRAQTAVGNALRDGKIKREPCSMCGTASDVHAHHKNYSKPLDVIWLCAKCHHRLHAAFPELGGHHASVK